MANTFGQVGGALADKLFSGILWFGVGVIVMVALGVTMWYFLIYKKKFDIRVKLTSERSGADNVEMLDKAAILRERKEGKGEMNKNEEGFGYYKRKKDQNMKEYMNKRKANKTKRMMKKAMNGKGGCGMKKKYN